MTTPTGRLAYGQAGIYDAVDDRSVITAVTNNRAGLISPVVVTAGAGLLILIRGGWVGVARCGDLTSAVVGSREDVAVQANPGPATDSRTDYVWCDVDPDEGTWELRVITAAQAANRPGLPLVEVTVPANANLASQMNLTPVDASVERRLMASLTLVWGGGVLTYTSWAQAAGHDWALYQVLMEPGQWYRVRATYSQMQLFSGSLSGRIGVGYRTTGQPASAAINARTAAVSYAATGRPVATDVEWVFRHAKDGPLVWRTFSTRCWSAGAAQFYPGVNEQPHIQLTVEDIGS